MFRIYFLIAAIAAGGAAYAYHTVTVAELESQVSALEANNLILKGNNNRLEVGLQNQKEQNEKLVSERDEERARVDNLTVRNNELQKEKDRYLRIFKDHNLTRLARAKPGLIENRINKGTAEVFRQVENDTKNIMALDDNDDTDGMPTVPETTN
jgi:hypothetical protein